MLEKCLYADIDITIISFWMQVITFSDFVILYLERNYLDKFCDCVVGKMRGTYEKYYKNNISDICSYSDWWMR